MFDWLKQRMGNPSETLAHALQGQELPSFSNVVLSALESLRSPNSSLAEIGEKISADPGVSARLLKIANSPAYSLRHPVRDVAHAVSLLGRSESECILLAATVPTALPKPKDPGYDGKRFWRAAARRATTARGLAAVYHPASRGEAFTAALLQDMALPLLLQSKGRRYGAVLEQWHSGTEDLSLLEHQAFGWTHAEIAGAVCATWKFPEPIANAIARHHDNDSSEDDELVSVSLVGLLREQGEEPEVDALAEAASDLFGASRDEVRTIVARAWEQADQIAALMV